MIEFVRGDGFSLEGLRQPLRSCRQGGRVNGAAPGSARPRPWTPWLQPVTEPSAWSGADLEREPLMGSFP